MRNTMTIALKESKVYFSSPMAYVVGAMFLILTGIFFVDDVTSIDVGTPFPEASIRGVISSASFFIVFLAPLLTMRLLAEEQKMGTLELLLTAPVRDWEVVMGKYIASFLALVATIALSVYYVFLLYWFAQPDTGPILSSFLGLFLHGAAALAVGLLASSLSANQIISAVIGIAVLLVFSLLDQVADLLSGVAEEVLNGVSMAAHFDDFSKGVVDTSDIVYYLSLAAVFLFLTVRSLETRRWR